jgi:peptidoglycan/xylan/chitin deacetylase (PgdA/CDA1 family)
MRAEPNQQAGAAGAGAGADAGAAGADAGAGKMAPPRRAPGLMSRLRWLATRALPRSVLVRQGASTDRRVALTFDDGPHEMTDAYLDTLDRFGARATFFVVGNACAAHREAPQRIVDRGSEVAGHGFSHRSFAKMDVATLRAELRQTSALLPRARGAAGRPLVRPPYGATSMRSLAVCAAAGYTTVMWSRDSDDCRTTSADQVAARVAPGAIQPGEIVLLHEGQSWTLAALPRILEALRAAGWQAVTVGELLASSAR